jgi:hypothetical protein
MFSMNYQKSFTLTFNITAENHDQQQAIFADVEEYRLHMEEEFLAHRARQPCVFVQPGANIGAPSTFRQANSTATENASDEATTAEIAISSSDDESEEGGGHGVEEV